MNDQLQAIAAAYESLPSGRTGDPQAEQSDESFRLEVIEQYRGLPVRVETWQSQGQPYATSSEMFADLDTNGRLYVYTGGEEHPFLSRDENVMLRAVHDFYGHFLGRFSFGPRGEVLAWRVHCLMFSEEAKPAVTAETLGQNCWFEFGPFRHLPRPLRPFAEQKASLLPEALWRPIESHFSNGPMIPFSHGEMT